MLVQFGVETLSVEWTDAVVCIGTFDGVHLGHQAVIRAAVDRARTAEQPAILVTFDRHPAATLAPDRRPPSVGILSQRLEVFARLGVAMSVVLPFDRALSQMSAEEFLTTILRSRLHAGRVVVGHDFAMGHGRVGTGGWLAERIETTIVPAVEREGRRVSSSDIRRAVAEGRMEAAGADLGRPFELGGVVVRGQRLGRELGYPTINLARARDQVVPCDGVYAGRARTPYGAFTAAVSVGVRPAVGGKSRTIEAYLLDYPGEPLYGAAVGLQFLSRLRDEEPFDSLEALQDQMARDVAEVRARADPTTT